MSFLTAVPAFDDHLLSPVGGAVLDVGISEPVVVLFFKVCWHGRPFAAWRAPTSMYCLVSNSATSILEGSSLSSS